MCFHVATREEEQLAFIPNYIFIELSLRVGEFSPVYGNMWEYNIQAKSMAFWAIVSGMAHFLLINLIQILEKFTLIPFPITITVLILLTFPRY